MVFAPALIASWQYCFALTGNAKNSIVAIIMKKFFVVYIAALVLLVIEIVIVDQHQVALFRHQ